MGRIIAIDWGGKRTGLAWTDPLQMIASRLEGVATYQLIDRLKKWVEKEKVETLLLGYPTRMNGEDTHATQPVREFEKKLRQTFPALEIVLWDERMTSSEAMQALIRAGVPQKKRRNKSLLDEMSATLMLQEYLDSIL